MFTPKLNPLCFSHFYRGSGTALVLALFVSNLGTLGAATRAEQAAQFKTELVEKVMPYWYDTAVDRDRGGFILDDDGNGRTGKVQEKQLVTQTRLIWGFSHAHLNGLGDGKRDYLAAAEQGYRFLQEHFLDRQFGGYYWTTDLSGKPISRNKIVYGESFVIYGLVEYYRASGNKEALQQAMNLYRLLQTRSHDAVNGGWIEHFTENWKPLPPRSREAVVEVAGFKSANTHLHLMEAFTELHQATGDREVRKSLEEALRLNMKYFYPRQAGRSCFHRHQDWSPVQDESSQGLSYGHNVEFAWLMIRAQQVLKRPPAWSHALAHIDHALKYGYDHERGGVYNRGADDQPATNLDKVWWVQSEMLAALTDALSYRERRTYSKALDSLVDWINRHQADPKDAIWYDTVSAEGTPKSRSKAHNWKGNYHDVRALVKYVQAFGGK